MSFGVLEDEEKAFFFWFVNNWNPIFKIHFLIFLNFLGNQTVVSFLSYSSIFLLLSCYCVYGYFGNFDNWVGWGLSIIIGLAWIWVRSN